MKGRSIAILLLIVCLIAGAIFTAVNGIKLGSFEIMPVGTHVNLGLDIKGGVVVVYEAQTDQTGDELRLTMEQTKQIISKRIDSIGLVEPIVKLQGEKRLRIELPGVSNAEEAISVIGKTALLEFRVVSSGSMASNGMNVLDFESEQILTGLNVIDAFVTQDSFGQPSVALKFDEEGKTKFYEGTLKAATQNGSNGQIAILLDSVVLTAPVARNAIDKGEAIITGNMDLNEAQELALLIRGGALPVVLSEIQTSVIGPTLGTGSLSSALTAGLYGVILIALFMIFSYRLPGVVATVALSLYSLIIIFSMVVLKATLTLPGIAGILISLGMAVDANVIIFERIKEELGVGKSLRSAIDAGFKRAFMTIIDSNVTTFIAALVLFFFGEGPIKGFAVTFMLGIVASMISAISITWFLLKLFSNITKNTTLYGVRR